MTPERPENAQGPAPGFVYLVGAGPWDPGLLTLRGRALLARCDTVVYDYLVNPELLGHAPDGAERIPVGRKPERLDQDRINDLLVTRARAGEVVVRLKGGDPFVFGRGGEEAEALVAAGVSFEVVPGVTAAIAGAAFAGIPVTHRGYGSTLALVTGHRAVFAADDVDWSALARMSTVALYMSVRRLPAIRDALIDAGRAPETPVALIRWASRPDQETVVTTLEGCAEAARDAGLEPPMTILVGEVVELRRRIGWYEQRPLWGRRVAVTRSQGQQGPLAHRLHELGAEVVPLPTIAFEAGPEAPVAAAIARLGAYDRVIFTSANGVDYFLDALYAAGRDPRAFGAARLACIGPATARRLRARGLVADTVPETFVAEGLLDALLEEGIAGQRILIPRAAVAREILPETLRAHGAEVEVLPVYRTVQPPIDPAALARVVDGEVDLVTFTSSSTVHHFRALFDDATFAAVKGHVGAACIGPITADTAREHGLRIAVVAERYTIPGLVDALVALGRGEREASDG